ncbi:tryptophan synthase subunit beta [Actinokineospora sp. PR83]|uniref:tryptophan synthase subunit beta n=1 Tax=Actinokineospora sp. PR83 TaxID=2884908 RepID=UPI0027DF26B7|nr:tryptophan synthase subunit beta [Actinokineospora sp. PR83]MCG8917245.1 tryptophan synthase subunit beta [Actinokineospora sp. PR83]
MIESRFGRFGGRYVPETLMAALDELDAVWSVAREDPEFWLVLHGHQDGFVGRPTPLYFAERLTEHHGGARIHFKREDLCHTGAHKLNNALGQVLLAIRMGKRRIIAETGAGQHGVATATVCARFGLPCVVYMGAEDARRQEVNVRRMRMLGAEVRPVDSGSATLKDATSEAIRDWVTNVGDTHYVIGSAVGPAPYPALVRDLQRVIGDEAREQYLRAERVLPDAVVACVGGGSNAIGMFSAFVGDTAVDLVGVEAGGRGVSGVEHAAATVAGSAGVLHGSMSRVLQDRTGLIRSTHSVAAGLDYPGVGPEHAMLAETGRARYVAVDDADAVAAFRRCTALEGIMPALETAHALHHVGDLARELGPGGRVLVCFSGRGDKDMHSVAEYEEAHR